MKKRFCLIVIVVYMMALCGCVRMDYDYYNKKNAFDNTIHSFFDALDRRDAEAIYQLFSPAVREQDGDLQEQIQKLMTVYQNPTDEIGWNGLTSSGARYENGKKQKDARAVFPVRSGDTYFWCDLEIIYIDTFDESWIGINQLAFYTAEECCIMRYGAEKWPESLGLEVYAERTLEEEVRCIDGWPHKYSASTETLNLEDVLRFLETSNSLTDFKAQFGEPNAEFIYYYYELPEEDGSTRYLQIGEDKGEIYGANIVDEFRYIEKVFDADGK